VPTSFASSVTAVIRISPQGPSPESMTQQRRHFFWDIDDDVSLTQIFAQECILTAKLLIFFF
jgi:hypothetical protein